MAIGDVNYLSTVLLLSPEGAEDSTAILDLSANPKTVLRSGDVRFKTAQARFGSSSIFFDGAGDKLTLAGSADQDLGNTFTVEFSLYPLTLPGSGNICRLFMWGVNATLSSFTIQFAPDGTMYAGVTAGGVTILTAPAGTVTTGSWQDFELSVNAGSACLYKGTTRIAGPVAVTAPTSSGGTNLLNIGFDVAAGSDFNYHGYLDNFRITKGVARNTGTTRAATILHPPYHGQVQGIIYDDTGAPCSRVVRAIRRDTGALVASTVSNATTGAYTLNCPTLDEVCRIVHDDSAGVFFNDLIDRVIPG